jgi:hypothetical protein
MGRCNIDSSDRTRASGEFLYTVMNLPAPQRLGISSNCETTTFSSIPPLHKLSNVLYAKSHYSYWKYENKEYSAFPRI